jgi:hypothetical protein
MRRSATDCTRPAERAPGSLRHKHGREREADEIIERAAREIGVDQFLVDLAGMGDGVHHGRFGHRVEHDPLDMGVAQRLLLLEDFQHMPGNGLAFAVRVGGQDQLVGAFEGVGDVLDSLLAAGIDLPGHGEVVVRLHRAFLGGQVADMAEARQDRVVRSRDIY